MEMEIPEKTQQQQYQQPYLIITSELNPFTSHLIAPNVRWFNEDKSRAEELANMLLPNRQGTSLRLADHLVVQYSRDHNIMIRSDCSDVPTELWSDYRRILACTGKRFFDVFKRKNAINARLMGTDIVTTVGQIVFLCWYQKRGLPQYMAEHEKEVRYHMQNIERGSTTDSSSGKQTEFSLENMDPNSPFNLAHMAAASSEFQSASDRGSTKRAKKRKSRAPSRSDSVKPLTRLYEGRIVMSYD